MLGFDEAIVSCPYCGGQCCHLANKPVLISNDNDTIKMALWCEDCSNSESPTENAGPDNPSFLLKVNTNKGMTRVTLGSFYEG